MSSGKTLQPVVEHGWLSGFANLLRKENSLWWGTRKWWVQTLVWLVISNGMIAFILWGIPLVDPSPTMIFSIAFIGSASTKCWCTIPIPILMASRGEENVTSCPL